MPEKESPASRAAAESGTGKRDEGRRERRGRRRPRSPVEGSGVRVSASPGDAPDSPRGEGTRRGGGRRGKKRKREPGCSRVVYVMSIRDSRRRSTSRSVTRGSTLSISRPLSRARSRGSRSRSGSVPLPRGFAGTGRGPAVGSGEADDPARSWGRRSRLRPRPTIARLARLASSSSPRSVFADPVTFASAHRATRPLAQARVRCTPVPGRGSSRGSLTYVALH